jgi:N-acyl-D-aspartate/D-glutamate deacylase
MLDLLIKGGDVVDGTGRPRFKADIGIGGGRIVGVGDLSGPARRTIDATGMLVTPGWVDIHTHYDGQATWDMLLDPSFSSGVTTAILGNCGVGFAPVARGDEGRLIDLMDGVEEIPGGALHAGLKWNWSTFPEYLDVLDSKPRSFDVGCYLPHGPLRLFVLGDKVGSGRKADADEIERMAGLVDEAMLAGAFGVSSSRTSVHRTVHGDMTPDFEADREDTGGPCPRSCAAPWRHGVRASRRSRRRSAWDSQRDGDVRRYRDRNRRRCAHAVAAA